MAYTASSRDALGNTSPSDLEISWGVCTLRKISWSSADVFPNTIHPSSRQNRDTIFTMKCNQLWECNVQEQRTLIIPCFVVLCWLFWRTIQLYHIPLVVYIKLSLSAEEINVRFEQLNSTHWNITMIDQQQRRQANRLWLVQSNFLLCPKMISSRSRPMSVSNLLSSAFSPVCTTLL